MHFNSKIGHNTHIHVWLEAFYSRLKVARIVLFSIAPQQQHFQLKSNTTTHHTRHHKQIIAYIHMRICMMHVNFLKNKKKKKNNVEYIQGEKNQQKCGIEQGFYECINVYTSEEGKKSILNNLIHLSFSTRMECFARWMAAFSLMGWLLMCHNCMIVVFTFFPFSKFITRSQNVYIEFEFAVINLLS